MAVLAQLHIARLQFGNAMNQYQRADEIAGVDQRIARHVDNQVRAQKQAGLEQVSQQAGAILSSLRRYQALSNMQAAAAPAGHAGTGAHDRRLGRHAAA